MPAPSTYRLLLAALLGGAVAAVSVGGYLHHVLSQEWVTAYEAGRSGAADQRPARLAARSPAAVAALPTPIDLRPAARRAIPVVVHITARTDERRRSAIKELLAEPRRRSPDRDGEGSGVIYTSDGHIVTNEHVVRGAEELTVTTAGGQTYPAVLVGTDPTTDLAVLRIQAQALPFLELADSDAAEPGEWVLAVGNPLGLTSTVTAGILSARGRNLNLIPELDAIESFLQTDAAVNPGNSGGALVTADGRLLGINTAIASRTGRFQGHSFAIPSNLVRRVADDLIEFGSYRRAFLGIEISTFSDDDRRRLRLPDTVGGVIIDDLLEGGSAAAAGLRIDDLITRVDGRRITDVPDLTELIGRAQVGEALKVEVVRNGSPQTVIVPLRSAQ